VKNSVLNRRGRVVTLALSMSVVWVLFILNGFPWTGLLLVSLAFCVAFWAATNSTPSIANVIDDIEAEPVPATGRPVERARR